MESAVMSRANLGDLFKRDSVHHDNILFKLHHQVNFFVILVGVVFIFGENYLNGKAITCLGGNSFAEQFCWLHGTGHIPNELAEKITEPCNNGDDTNNNREMHYYIWLPFVLAICLLFVKLPRILWKSVVERGMMEGLTKTDLPAEKIVMKVLKGHSKRKTRFPKVKLYHLGFAFCELLNIAFLLISFFVLDSLLNGDFFSYGSRFNDWSVNKAEYEANLSMNLTTKAERPINPMCALFPTEVACEVCTGAVSGGCDTSNIICILSNNLFNQYYFLILWFWWVFLLGLSCLGLVYRMAQLTVGGLGRAVLRSYLTASGSEEVVDQMSYNTLSPELCFLLGRMAINMKGSRMSEVMEEILISTSKTKKMNMKEPLVNNKDEDDEAV